MELTDKQIKRANRIEKIFAEGDLAVAEHLFELEESVEEGRKNTDERFEKVDQKIEELKEVVEPNMKALAESLRGKDGYTPQKGVDYFDGEKGESGKTYILSKNDKKEIARLVEVPIVEKVIEKTEVIHEQPIVTQEIKEVAIAESPEQLRDKLKTLKDDERLPKEAIKGIEDIEKDIEMLKKRPVTQGQGGVVSRDYFVDIDLSDQLDGFTKTFNIQAIRKILSVDLQSYPYGALRKGIDYTYTNTTIAFTDTIDASTQLAEGQVCVITATIS